MCPPKITKKTQGLRELEMLQQSLGQLRRDAQARVNALNAELGKLQGWYNAAAGPPPRSQSIHRNNS